MHTYDIHINADSCIGDRSCAEEAPNTFMMDTEGKATLIIPGGGYG